MDADLDLILSCLRMDIAAQNQFYRKFASKMYGLCLRYAGNRMEAEDMLQEGFLRVFYNLKYYRFEGSLEGWVRRIMVNTALNFHKKSLKFQNEVELENFDLHATLFEDALSKLSREDILRIIQSLPVGYRTIFNLYVMEGYPHKEIAKLLGISENTSKTQLRNAKLAIQKELGK